MLTMHAMLQERPDGHADTRALASREASAEAADYDEARAGIDRQTPDGRRCIWLRVDR